jgi:hypothetical protein
VNRRGHGNRRGTRRLAPALLAAWGALIADMAASHLAAAADIGDPSSPLSLQVHAFVSQGAILTTNNDYLVPASSKGSFQLSEVGINFTSNLTDKLRAGIQLFAQDFGWAGNYNVQADWFYLDYRQNDWLGIRAGRLKIPFGLFNEVNDIDSARVPILLPQSIYPLQSRQFLFAQSGFELYGFVPSRWAGALDYRLFAGTIYLDPAKLVPLGQTFQTQFEVPYVTGGRLMWETPVEGLRVGASLEALALNATFVGLPMPLPPSGYVHNHSVLWVASAEYARGDAVLSAEYSRSHHRQESDVEAGTEGESESLYAMFTYRFAPWFQPGVYYSLFFPQVDNRWGNNNANVGPADKCAPKSACWQHDASLTLRFDITTNWLLKLEAHFMDGTAGLTNPVQLGSAPSGTKDWETFLAKTTVYF